MLDELAFNCGTPSMNVVTAGLFGLEPMPRKRALLSLRAVNSLKKVFGAYCAASLTLSTPAFSMVSWVTAVTLTGASWTFSGSFCARTVTVGRRTRIVPSSSCVAWELDDWPNAGETKDIKAARTEIDTRCTCKVEDIWEEIVPRSV